MAYNPYSDVKNIYNLKGQWENANIANDDTKKNEAAKKAQAYYNSLRDNGYSDTADKLAANNYANSKAIHDYYAATGRTKTRDYLYSLGKSKGMSQKDVDNLIEWDNNTGEVSFGGKKIGAPEAVVDGVSYWGDTSTLDNAFNDYINRSGYTVPDDMLYKQTMQSNVNKNNEQWSTIQKNVQDMLSKYNDEYEYLKNTNPFETDTAKAILAKYDLAGLQGRDNQVAMNAGSNGGNIDSYAAANAMRQQAALINQGQMVALDAHRQRLSDARDLLSNLGVQMSRDYADQNTNIQMGSQLAQQLFDNNETRMNNEVAREATKSQVTGYAPIQWSMQNDAILRQYIDDNGKLKDEYKDIDFQARINDAKARGDEQAANRYAILRGLKLGQYYDKYGQFANEGDVAYYDPQRTADFEIENKQLDTSVLIANAQAKADADAKIAAYNAAKAEAEYDAQTKYAELQNNIDVAQIEADAKKADANSSGYKPTLTAEQVKEAIKNGEVTQGVIDAYNYYYSTNYTVNNPPKATINSSSNSGNDKGTNLLTGNKPLSKNEVDKWANAINREFAKRYGAGSGSSGSAFEMMGASNSSLSSLKSALIKKSDGTYKIADADADFIILQVLNATDLNQDQKDYLLYDKFGITPDQVNNVLRDRHYKE